MEPELTHLILKELEASLREQATGACWPRDWLASAALVSRTWAEVAQPLLYEHLEPKNKKQLSLLRRTLRSNPLLASYVHTLVTPHFSFSRGGGKRIKWRARPLFVTCTNTRVYLSENDYNHMLRMFASIARYCPNITDMCMPICTSVKTFGFGPHFSIDEAQSARLEALTLSPLVFPRHSANTSNLTFPALRELTIKNLKINDTRIDIVHNLVAPRLETLKVTTADFHGKAFGKFIMSVGQIKNLEIVGCDSLTGFGGWPWDRPDFSHLSELDSWGPALNSIQRLSIEGARSYNASSVGDLSKLTVLRSLEIHVNQASTFFELMSSYPALRELKLIYNNNSKWDPAATFKMVNALSRFIQRAPRRASKLRVLTINWKFVRDARNLELAKTLAFCLAMRARKTRVNLKLNLEAVDVSYAEEVIPNRQKWSRSKTRPSAIVDKTLSFAGWKMYW